MQVVWKNIALELREGPAPELGYWLGVPYWGRGYATEAVRALIDLAFRDPTVTRVIAETFPDLIPSIRVLEKNGFVRIEEGGSEPGVIRFELRRT